MWLYSIISFRRQFIFFHGNRLVMAYSTTRGLLYMTPPTEDEDRTATEPTAENHPTATAQSDEANRSRPVADD
jgi:hypothetical protein